MNPAGLRPIDAPVLGLTRRGGEDERPIWRLTLLENMRRARSFQRGTVEIRGPVWP